MAIVIIDNAIQKSGDIHPAYTLDKEHPCVIMVREMIDGKPTFHWNYRQALQMYHYYVERYHSPDLVDDFGDYISVTKFKEWIEISHYLEESGKKKVPSEFTIKEAWSAREMEKKMMEANGETE